jgi:large subunit ribosomal protein L29
MAKNKLETKGLAADALIAQTTELESTVSKLKFEHAVRGLANPTEIKVAKKNVARLKTEARAREISEMTSEQLASRTKIRNRRRSN